MATIIANVDPRHSRETKPVMNDLMPPLPGPSPVSGRTVVAKFDGSLLSSDGYILILREVGLSLCVSDRRPACVEDTYVPDRAPTVSLADIIRFSTDNDRGRIRRRYDVSNPHDDTMFTMQRLAPAKRELCSHSVIVRLETLSKTRTLLRLAAACRSLLRFLPIGYETH